MEKFELETLKAQLERASREYLAQLHTRMEQSQEVVDGLQKEIDEAQATLGETPSLVNESQASQKYKYLIDAAKKCFGGTVYEAWAKADHTVRVRFKQKQRELCDAKIAELDAPETKSTGEEEAPCVVPDLSSEELAHVAELAQEGGTR